MRRLAVVTLALAIAISANGLLGRYRAGAQPIPGATYTGTLSDGGAVQFTVSPDGASLAGLRVEGAFLSKACGFTSISMSEGESASIQEHTFTVRFGPIGAHLGEDGQVKIDQNTMSGSFPEWGTSEGTISCYTRPGIFGRMAGAEGGTSTWAATAAGAAPVPLPSPPSRAVLQQQCSTSKPGTVLVTFSWQPSGAGSQWLDLSLSDNGFAPGTYVGVGPLPPGSSTFAWDGLVSGMTHYARVNTATPAGWSPSQTLTFTTGFCGGPAVLGEVVQGCGGQPGTVDATFQWSPSMPRGSVQWLDLSLVDNGFAPGTFVSAGPLDPATTSFTWAGVRSGLAHYWRVNTLTPTGWQPTPVALFVTGYCP